jgi:hypothetical protein
MHQDDPDDRCNQYDKRRDNRERPIATKAVGLCRRAHVSDRPINEAAVIDSCCEDLSDAEAIAYSGISANY